LASLKAIASPPFPKERSHLLISKLDHISSFHKLDPKGICFAARNLPIPKNSIAPSLSKKRSILPIPKSSIASLEQILDENWFP
jgi:hypothetical protein